METLALLFLFAAGVGMAAIAAQHLVLWIHVRQAPPVPRRTPPVSILKPLCGVDDGLEANLASFSALAYPEYEVVLGVRDVRDAAYPVALAAARRSPGRFRVAVQQGEPGLNPKVNQLATLARAARHDVLVVSDSNVRVHPGYLSEIAALLEDDGVGLVTHPIVGVGKATLGSLMAGAVVVAGDDHHPPSLEERRERVLEGAELGRSAAVREVSRDEDRVHRHVVQGGGEGARRGVGTTVAPEVEVRDVGEAADHASDIGPRARAAPGARG